LKRKKWKKVAGNFGDFTYKFYIGEKNTRTNKVNRRFLLDEVT